MKSYVYLRVYSNARLWQYKDIEIEEHAAMNTVTWNSKTTVEVLTEKYIPGWKVLVGRSGKSYYFAYKSLTSDILWGAKATKKLAMAIFDNADQEPGTVAYNMGLPVDVLGWL